MAGRKSTTEAAKVATNWASVEAFAVDAMPVALQKSVVDDTPFPDWYHSSWETGTPRVIQCTSEEMVAEAKRLAATAANRYGRRYNVKAGLRNHVSEEYQGADGNLYRDYTFMAVDRTKVTDAEDLADEVSDAEADATE